MMKTTLRSAQFVWLFALFALWGQVSFALTKENRTVSGILKSETGEPLAYASVVVTNSKHGTSTDLYGRFNLRLAPGSYQIRFSYMGFIDREESIVVPESKSNLDLGELTLKVSDKQISEVVVRRQLNPVRTAESDYVARLPLKNLENPQLYVTVSDKLLKQQLSTSLDDALKNVPGAGVPIRFNQNRVVFFSRGFTTEPKFRNGLASFLQTSIDPVNTERIEVIKGPSATLFGSSVVSYGGLLNRVTKRPQAESFFNLEYLGGSWNLNRITADANLPLDPDKRVLLRVNGAVHRENSFQDAGFNNSTTVTPSLEYRLSDKVTLLADLEYGQNTGTSPIRFSPYTATSETRNVKDFGIAYKRSFAANDVSYKSSSMNLFLRMKADLGKNWKSETAVSRTYSGFDGFTNQLQGRTDTTLRAQVTSGRYDYYSTDIQQNFTGQFQGLGMSHKFVGGLDYFSYSSKRNTANVYSATVDFRGDLTAYYKTFNSEYLSTQAATATRVMQNNTTDTYSAYVSDAMTIVERFSALVGLRLDHFRNKGTTDIASGITTGDYDQTVLSPKFGLVYQIAPNQLAAFANYQNGFSNQNGTDKDGHTFKPEHATQYEGGLKADLWQNRLSGSVSYYHILVDDVLREDPTDLNYSIQDGQQRSQGVEFQLSAQPVKGLSILTGYAWNDSKYLKADEEIDGLRPVSAGPETTVNWWINYEFPATVMEGFHIGFGGNYGSESYQTNTTSAKVIIPSYLTLDLGAGWQNNHLRVAVKADNLTNEKYWSYRLAPQNPTRFTGSIAYLF